MDTCPNPECGESVSWDVEHCAVCGTALPPPNVRNARRDSERSALDTRYKAAIVESNNRGNQDSVSLLEQKLTNTSGAVINLDVETAIQLMSSNRALYTTYEKLLAGDARIAADFPNDRRRASIGGTFFGSKAAEIRYAALSLDGNGLVSYGKITLRLRDIAVQGRASLLECNTYVFAERHRIIAGDGPPPGYQSDWTGRARLGVAKLASKLTSRMTDGQYAKLLLNSIGDRSTDEFIEVHIYGQISANAFESAVLPTSGSTPTENANLDRLKEELDRRGITWTIR